MLQVAGLVSVAVSLAGYLAWLLEGVAVVWVGVWLWGIWAERAKRQRQAVLELVEQVLSILFHQHQMIKRDGKPGTTFLAIDHISDQLIEPSDRKRLFVQMLFSTSEITCFWWKLDFRKILNSDLCFFFVGQRKSHV